MMNNGEYHKGNKGKEVKDRVSEGDKEVKLTKTKGMEERRQVSRLRNHISTLHASTL